MSEELNKKILMRFEDAKSDAAIPLNEMKDISQYIFPSRGLFVAEGDQPHQNSTRYSKIIDPRATEDNDMLSSGIQGGLSSPSQVWFKLQTVDPALMQFESVAQWLYNVEQLMYAVLAGSNFYAKIHDYYGDHGAFGSGLLWSEEHFETLVTYKTCVPGEYFPVESELGTVDTLYRLYFMTARQIFKKWPDTCSDGVKNNHDKKGQHWHQVLHAIEPNEERDPSKLDQPNMPWKSVYIEYKQPNQTLATGGFNEQPFSMGRWKTNGSETFGRGPGHSALGLVKMLQSMQATSLKAFHKEADPPLLVPSSLKGRINTLPGGINYTQINDGRDSTGRLFEMSFDYQGAEAKIDRIHDSIDQIFKRELFLLIADRPEMTATEVVERSQEKIILLGPTIERNITDVLKPQLQRLYFILERAGVIPQSPQELLNSSLKFEFISVLAQAQKMIGMQNLRSYVGMATEVAAVDPGTLIKTNWDAVLQESADRLAINPNITLPDEVVAEIRAERQKQQQMAQEMEMLKGGTEAARNLSQADTTEGNLLADLTESGE